MSDQKEIAITRDAAKNITWRQLWPILRSIILMGGSCRSFFIPQQMAREENEILEQIKKLQSSDENSR